ncbi:hypothetical protein MVEN_01882900 [Mycena venus]|uniref:Uncharacterized protein n=1 Tax=Mycena venus TaxID=2733690 RepID=A0A8H7CMJ8_9AGAR|nr:hypothetical protein MVEN_01882900 [Mycena venus]
MVATRTKEYTSVAKTSRTSRKNLLQEVAEIGVLFNKRNEPDIWASEGALPSGSELEGAHALSVPPGPARASSPMESGDESDESSSDTTDTSSDSSSLFGLSSQGGVDWNATEGGFIVPRHTVKKKYEWLASDPLTNEYKFFPSWFDLSLEEDQLGPIPDEWSKQEEHDLQKAIAYSLAERNKQGAAEESRVRSMAIIVELPAESSAKAIKER